MPNDADKTLNRATLERALTARVAERVTAAGRRVEPVAVERIVRQVLDRLHPEALDGSAEPDPAVLVFVVETGRGELDLSEFRAVLTRTAARTGARLLAAHREPVQVSPPPDGTAPARSGQLANSLEMP